MRALVRSVFTVIVVAGAVAWPSANVEITGTSRPFYSAVESILPAEGAVVGVAHPVVVTFSGPITNRPAAELAVGVKSTPSMTGKYEWPESNVVQWVPDRFWPANSTVKLSVGGMPTQFKTGPAVIGVASISEHTFTVTIDGVEAEPPIRLPAPHHLPHAGEEGVLLASMGREEYPTPVGTYPVLEKERTVLMDSSSVGVPITATDGYLLDVDYAVRLTRRGIFVHSAPWAVKSMGIENTSHGCIGLIPAAAEWYFNTVNVGDPVIVQE